LRDDITTDLGVKLLGLLEEYYEPRLKDPRKKLAEPPIPPHPDPEFLGDS
jgi:hypothetical protein